jgi:glycosyltransferase involved in cell wall biosynthesis
LRPTVALERRVYREARAIVTQSRWAADSLATYGIPARTIEVIPFGIPVGPALEPRRDGGPPRLLFVGSAMDRKGGWRLLDLWRRHLADRSRLVLVTLEPVPAEHGLEVRNDIRPGDGQIDELLRTVDVFVMPSEIDSFGYALLEAMAGGLPVVAPRQAAVPEIVDDSRSGLLVPTGDDQALCDAIGVLVGDEGARREMGDAGRRRVQEHFDANVTTAALVEVLRSVARSGR